MPPFDKNPPEGGQGKKKSKRDYQTGISVASAMQAVKDLGLTDEGEIYRFFKKHSPAAFSLANTNPEKWVRLKPNKDYKAPVLESEIKAYQDYQGKTDEMKRRSDVSEFLGHLNKSGYAIDPKFKGMGVMSGKSIVEAAKGKGARVEKNDDGTYTLFDDETVFRDSDKEYGKGRTIYPDAKYNTARYRRGADLANVYNLAEPPAHSGRVPTEEEMQAYKEGNLNLIALDPQYKPYYASAYFDPAKQNGNDRTALFYGNNSSGEDVQRFEEFKAMQEKLKPVYERRAKLRKIVDKMIPDARGTNVSWEDRLGGAGIALSIPAVLAGGLAGGALPALGGMAFGSTVPFIGKGVGQLIDRNKLPKFKRIKKGL
jgi:hypothetical protein